MRTRWLVAVLLAGCGPDSIELSPWVFHVRAGEPDWRAETVQLTHPRAAHGAVAIPGGFLVFGGSIGELSSRYDKLQLTRDIERCVVTEPACTVVGSLDMPVEQPQGARAPDGTIAIAAFGQLQLFDPASGAIATLPIDAERLVTTTTGIAVLGIAGARDPRTNLPGPYTYGAIRTGAGIDPIAAPPADVWVQAATALDDTHVLVASTRSSATLDLATGAWTAAPAIPTTAFSVTAAQVAPGIALAIADGDPSAYEFSLATRQWTTIPVPSTSASIAKMVATSDGALVVGEDFGAPMTWWFRFADATWLAGPPGPPWSNLDALVVLDDGLPIAIGGASVDYIAERSAD